MPEFSLLFLIFMSSRWDGVKERLIAKAMGCFFFFFNWIRIRIWIGICYQFIINNNNWSSPIPEFCICNWSKSKCLAALGNIGTAIGMSLEMRNGSGERMPNGKREASRLPCQPFKVAKWWQAAVAVPRANRAVGPPRKGDVRVAKVEWGHASAIETTTRRK